MELLVTHKQHFLNYLRFEKRFSLHTSTSYSNDLDQFILYLNSVYQIDRIDHVNHSIIRSWAVSLMEKKLSARSVNRKISALKSFYKFLLREKQIDINPMSKIQTPKIPKRLPVFVEESKMNNLIEDIKFGSNFEGRRDLLMIELLYSTGMRRAELINLKEIDVNLHHGTIKVIGKRNKERLIPITHELGTLIKEYCDQKRYIKSTTHNLFITKNGKPIYASAVYRTVRNLLSKVTTLSKKSPHILRHTFATHLLNNGANLNAIKELLGHANLAATQVYTHNSIEKLKAVYSKAHPKAKSTQ